MLITGAWTMSLSSWFTGHRSMHGLYVQQSCSYLLIIVVFHVIVIKIYMLEFLKIIKSIFLYFNKTFKDRVKSTESKLRKALNWLKLNVVTECMTKRNMTLSRSYLKVKVIGQTYQPWMCVCVCVCVCVLWHSVLMAAPKMHTSLAHFWLSTYWLFGCHIL